MIFDTDRDVRHLDFFVLNILAFSIKFYILPVGGWSPEPYTSVPPQHTQVPMTGALSDMFHVSKLEGSAHVYTAIKNLRLACAN